MVRKNNKVTREELIAKIQGLGLQEIQAESVQFLQSQTKGRYMIEKPLIYYSPDLQTYVVFGDLREDNQQQILNIARLLQSQGLGQHDHDACDDPNCSEHAIVAAAQNGQTMTPGAAADVPEPQDSDITLVMEQANCSRERAIECLRMSNNEVLDAIVAAQE